MTEPANRPIKALLTMQEFVEEMKASGPISVTELAERVDRPPSVTHDYLSTLQQLGYVMKINGEYKLSLQYLELGTTIRESIPLYDVARHDINQLAQESNSELVTLSIEEGGLCVALDVMLSSRSIDYETSPGMHFHMHSSGAGKAMLAHYPDERVEEILDQHGMPAKTANTITDREDLFVELEEVQETGIAFEREEYKPRMQTISAPIMGPEEIVIGALSVSGPAHRLQENDTETELQNSLLSTVNVIELNYASR
ncbi:IclR family transcriptional regulator [Saliphagus sp. LR7]|uniref:IclR family transcriptional regulator n=1 Tax=Saliphagus sp. LR7 TaxID=2282654 RepID=UPI000DF7DC57|nr:IclR family transcriptional regulator [Saliphagus sp. LR7]